MVSRASECQQFLCKVLAPRHITQCDVSRCVNFIHSAREHQSLITIRGERVSVSETRRPFLQAICVNLADNVKCN